MTSGLLTKESSEQFRCTQPGLISLNYFAIDLIKSKNMKIINMTNFSLCFFLFCFLSLLKNQKIKSIRIIVFCLDKKLTANFFNFSRKLCRKSKKANPVQLFANKVSINNKNCKKTTLRIKISFLKFQEITGNK